MNSIAELKKLYKSKDGAKQDRKRALLVHNRLSAQNWSLADGAARKTAS